MPAAPEMLSTEIEGILEATTAPGAATASRQSVDAAIASRPLLPEQRDVVVELTTNPMRVQTVVGEAGTERPGPRDPAAARGAHPR